MIYQLFGFHINNFVIISIAITLGMIAGVILLAGWKRKRDKIPEKTFAPVKLPEKVPEKLPEKAPEKPHEGEYIRREDIDRILAERGLVKTEVKPQPKTLAFLDEIIQSDWSLLADLNKKRADIDKQIESTRTRLQLNIDEIRKRLDIYSDGHPRPEQKQLEEKLEQKPQKLIEKSIEKKEGPKDALAFAFGT